MKVSIRYLISDVIAGANIHVLETLKGSIQK